MTQDEIVSVILGKEEGDEELSYRRRLAPSHIGCGVKDARTYFNADNNHSGYWHSGFVHAVGRPLVFWDLDADFEDVLDEAFRVDPQIGSSLIRDYVFDIIEDDTKFTEALSAHSDNRFMHWLDQRRGELPPAPDYKNYDQGIAEKFYDALDSVIFKPLSEMQEYNLDIASVVSARAAHDDRYRLKILKNCIVDDVFPKNAEADGYVIHGHRTLFPSDALRGAIYIGNVCEALELHHMREPFLETEVQEASKKAYVRRDEALNKSAYPSVMVRGEASDWITNGPFTKGYRRETLAYGTEEDALDLSLLPKTRYPQFGEMSLMQINCDREGLEAGAVVHPPEQEKFHELRRTLVSGEVFNSEAGTQPEL
ncbi:MAG: hypothetical protein IPH06_02600 [Alphaproteobacteria bacterium]|nr:hypothetical protein [Alphaproteobacteria bacterium]